MEFRKNLAAIKNDSAETIEKQPDVSEVKVEVNNLLHMWLPPKTTLGDMDDLAMAICKTIMDAWDLKPKEGAK